jgi:predicted PurR-regulated permease PerM
VRAQRKASGSRGTPAADRASGARPDAGREDDSGPIAGRWLETGLDEAGPAQTAGSAADQPSAERTARRAFIVLLAGAVVLLALIVEPLAAALSIAAALAGVLWPLQRKLMRLLHCRRSVASGLLVAGVVLAIIGPLVALSAFAVKEASEGVQYVSETVRSEGVAGLIQKLPPPLRSVASGLVERLPKAPGQDIDETVEQQVTAQGGHAAEAVGAVVAATGSFFFEATMMLIALFFLLVHGDACVSWLDHVSPLKPGQTRELLREFKRVSYSVIVSTIITAGVQAAAALVGYFVASVPHPVFFGAVTFFVAFIPAIGAGGVCLTAAALLLLTGHPYAALFLAIWGLTVVGLIDNVVKPFLIKSGMELHGAVVFFSLIGGLLAFGPTGLLVGPLIVAFVLALLRIYQRDYSPDRAHPAPLPKASAR